MERRGLEDEKTMDEELLRPDVELAKSLVGVKIVEVLEDLGWLDLCVASAKTAVGNNGKLNGPLMVDNNNTILCTFYPASQ